MREYDPVDGVRANDAISLGKIHHDPETVVPGLVAAFLREQFGGSMRVKVIMIRWKIGFEIS